MTDKHLAEEEMQLYAMGQDKADAFIVTHLATCEDCRNQVAIYKAVLADINNQPEAVFDFDVASLVMTGIEPVKAKNIAGVFASIFPVALIICLVTIPLYIFRKNFFTIVTGISAVFIYMSLIACITIIFFKAMRMYNKYQQQIKKLNFSE